MAGGCKQNVEQHKYCLRSHVGVKYTYTYIYIYLDYIVYMHMYVHLLRIYDIHISYTYSTLMHAHMYIYISGVEGVETNREIVSFRWCVRAQLYVRSEWMSKLITDPFPFSVLA